MTGRREQVRASLEQRTEEFLSVLDRLHGVDREDDFERLPTGVNDEI